MKIPANKMAVHREMEMTTVPWLRHQVGYIENRTGWYYNRVTGELQPGDKVPIFVCCGFGTTLETAARKAGVILTHSKPSVI